MQIYKSYVVRKRYRGNGLTSEHMNLPYGETCRVVVDQGQGYIVCRDRRVCYVDSQTAFDYFSQNDDGNGLLRGTLINKIMNRLSSFNGKTKAKNALWYKVWNDEICQPYRRKDQDDYWTWNYEFYNAPINDLQYIAKLVGAK